METKEIAEAFKNISISLIELKERIEELEETLKFNGIEH